MTQEEKNKLLEEAKRRYPINSQFKSFITNEIKTVIGHDFYFSHDGLVLRSNSIKENENSAWSVYKDGNWAEIVSKPEEIAEYDRLDKPYDVTTLNKKEETKEDTSKQPKYKIGDTVKVKDKPSDYPNKWGFYDSSNESIEQIWGVCGEVGTIKEIISYQNRNYYKLSCFVEDSSYVSEDVLDLIQETLPHEENLNKKLNFDPDKFYKPFLIEYPLTPKESFKKEDDKNDFTKFGLKPVPKLTIFKHS